MKMKRGIIQMLVAAVITLFAASCSDMVEELKVQEELKFLTPGSYTISGTDYTIMKTLVTKNGESAGTVDSNGLVTINVDSSTTYEITVVKDGTLTLVKNDSSSVVTYVGKFTFKTKTETTLKNTADASDTIVFVMNAEIGALPDGTYEIDGTNYTISDKNVAKESDGISAGSVGSDGIVTVNKSESEGLTITVFGDYSVEALKTTTADGETTKKFYKGAFESSIATLKKDGTDDSDTLVIKKIASAGNISYATTSVSKTSDDEPFTNELTKTGDGTVSYASSKTDVAEVNTQTGLVTIKGAGETTITATVADSESYTYAVKTASYTLTVTAADTTQQKSAGSISYATTTVSKTTADVAFTNELTKTGDGTVTYTSDNTAVATVNEDGEVTIKGAGTATITATVADSDTYTYATKTATYTLTVEFIPEGFVKVAGTTIAGTETWTPPSEVFVAGRSLTIGDLYVCDHEVTRGEFKALMGEDPSTADAYDKDGNLLTGDYALNNPVNCVNWHAAIAYCNKLSVKEGLAPAYTVSGITDWESLAYSNIPTSDGTLWDFATCDFEANGYRLPTEVEWEWLARGGQNYTYAGSDTVGEVAWYTDNTNDSGSRDVKTKAANGYGLYDMSGNVLEWCWDCYDEDISSCSATGAAFSYAHVIRGGSWSYSKDFCTVSYRLGINLGSWFGGLGFRVVRSSSN